MLARMTLYVALAAALHPTSAGAELSALWPTCTGLPNVNWDRQIESCTAIIESDQETQARRAVAYNHRGLAWQAKIEGPEWHENQTNAKRAIADYSEAIRLDASYADAYYNRGTALEFGDYRGEIDRFIADYTEAIRLDPNHAAAYNRRGDAWATKRDLDRAIADYNEAIRLRPKYALTYWRRGGTWFDKGEFGRAIADYDEVIRLEPDNAGAHSDRAKAYVATGDYDRAIADYTRAIRLEPDDHTHYADRGYAYFLHRNFSASAADFHRAIVQSPRHGYVWNHVLFRYIARARAGQNARVELAQHRTRDPARLFDLYLGRSTPEAALKDSDPPFEDRCVTEFFVGAWHLIRGERNAARARLRAASADGCREFFPHHHIAVIELKRLGQ
jgi:tetratricopeptide (TPR) repeat protein